MQPGAFENIPLPHGIRSRCVPNINGLTIHLLQAGFETKERPGVVLLHGFPELAYSWRKVMLPIAAAGFHVIAPDPRGYGRTTGWDGDTANEGASAASASPTAVDDHPRCPESLSLCKPLEPGAV